MTTDMQMKVDPDYEVAPAQGAMTLVEHLTELRQRLIWSIGGVATATVVSYFVIDQIMACLVAPAEKLYYLSPAEAFFAQCKVAFVCGLLIGLPLLCYHIWAFFAPALTHRERSIGLVLVPGAAALFYLGTAFAYHFALPAAIRFFLGFATDSLTPMLSLGEYIAFVLSFCLSFGFVFQLPIVMLVLALSGIVVPSFFAGKRKYVVVLSFVAGAIISPTPDIIGQTMLALPIIVLFEVSLVLTRLFVR